MGRALNGLGLETKTVESRPTSEATNFVEIFLNECQKKTRIFIQNRWKITYIENTRRLLFVVLSLKLRSLIVCFLSSFSSDRVSNVPVNPCRQSQVFSQRNAKRANLINEYTRVNLWLGADHGNETKSVDEFCRPNARAFPTLKGNLSLITERTQRLI